VTGILPYGRQALDEVDIAAVVDVLRSDFLTTGPVVDAFEQAFSRRIDAPHAVACSSGTAALHLAALALGLGPGDSVIVPTITFLATANAARYVGAEVIFADVNPDNGVMEPEHLERALAFNADKRIAAVFPVHLAGQPADPEGVAAVAERAGLRVVEDACHALGTRYNSNGAAASVGACLHADMTVFSFHPVKTIACGEGGMVTTRDADLDRRLRRSRNHGMVHEASDMENSAAAFDSDGTLNPWYYEMPDVGFNYRLSDVHAALGLSQLGKLDRFLARRRDLVARYDRLLASLDSIIQPVARVAAAEVGWHLYPVLIDFDALGISRRAVMTALRKQGIGTQVHYIPVHEQPYYRGRYGAADLPGAGSYYRRTLSLPLYPGMADDDVDRVVDALSRAIEGGEKTTVEV
jgi:UDP-4-amino-4,6-dideoxy-N-acetyl-beta-L-altrosamine transaminase